MLREIDAVLLPRRDRHRAASYATGNPSRGSRRRTDREASAPAPRARRRARGLRQRRRSERLDDPAGDSGTIEIAATEFAFESGERNRRRGRRDDDSRRQQRRGDARARGRERRPRRRGGDRRDRSGRVGRPDRRPGRRRVRDLLPDRRSQSDGHGGDTRRRVGGAGGTRDGYRRDGHRRGQRLRGS